MSRTVKKVVKFPHSTLQNYTSLSEFGQFNDLPTVGGIFTDTNHSWLARGPCLEVRNNKTGCKIGAWTFGYILKDSSTRVVCVDEIKKPNGRLPLLVVGLNCAISGGLICIFDVYGSKVIRTIQIKDKITSVHVVDAGFDDLNLRGPLRTFDGILTVGTRHGNVFLIDICRQICEEALEKIDSLVVRDELFPCQVKLIAPKDVSRIEYYKEIALREGNHLAIHLNVVTDSKTEHFTLRGQKGEDRLHVNKEEVAASSLFYCSQLTSLLVGYNFGAFQLWNLSDMMLVYTSPVCKEHMPITHFSFLEPDDDPKAFCYVWAVYSSTEVYQVGLPFAVLYSFCYENKDYQEGYGYLYQDFQYCGVAFQVELNAVEGHKSSGKLKGGHCIGLQSLQHKLTSGDDHVLSRFGEVLTLSTICWNVWYNNKEVHTNMIVFDLNQWYKEQMPRAPNSGSGSTNYMIKMNLMSPLAMMAHKSGMLLNCKIDGKSVRQFIGTQKLEEHFYPTSLNYDIVCLTDEEVAHIHNQGLQKAILGQIEAAGPLCLVRPAEVFQQILMLGLTPLYMDEMVTPVSTDVQREVVLNVGLENQLVGWLCRCASEWANGSFSSAGCTLDSLICWAFQRATVLKTNCDSFCIPLFNYSQVRLDSNTCTLLNGCTRQINNLCVFYSHIVNKLSGYLTNIEVVTDQYKCLQTVSVYFEVLQWLVNVGLLPEGPPSTYPRPDESERISAPYPVQKLTEYYTEQRALLQLKSERSFATNESLLFIDNLIENECGAEKLQKYWQEDGGSGLYPPPSLQSLLRTYLIDGPDIGYKHSLVLYVFLDLAMTLEQERYDSVITYLIKFPAVFKVSASLIKITQAFWQLDHGDYTTAMEQLLDPFVLNEDLHNWHHTIALRSLLLQNQHHFALLYMQVRKPPILNEKDIFTAISLFIANNMLDEAFYFQKQYQNKNNEDLLMHLFQECNKNESLKVILYRYLDNTEEKAFFKYLQTIKNPNTDDLQVFYYLLRSRFIEAFDTHQNAKRMKPECQGLMGQKLASRTDNTVRIFKNLLPDVNKNLVEVVRRERTNLWKKVDRPTPLSVFVHNATEQVQYKSAIIHAALSKAKQTFNGINKSMEVNTEDTPFLRTPKALPSFSKRETKLIDPIIIEEDQPLPAKRMKISPRLSKHSTLNNTFNLLQTTMTTPLIKRKRSNSGKDFHVTMCTPQSILKVKIQEALDDTINDMSVPDAVPRERRYLSVSPRKSLSRTPLVRFDAACYSTSLSDASIQTPSPDNTTHQFTMDLSNKTLLKVSAIQQSISSSSTDVFYSPDTSMNNNSSELDENKARGAMPEEEPAVDVQDSLRGRRSYKRSFEESNALNKSEQAVLPDVSSEDGNTNDSDCSFKLNYRAPSTNVYESPKLSDSLIEKMREPMTPRQLKTADDLGPTSGSSRERRTFKGSFSEITPIRSSPRRKSSTHQINSDFVTLRRKITKETTTSTKETLFANNQTVVSLNETHEESTAIEERNDLSTSKKLEGLPRTPSEDSSNDSDCGLKLKYERSPYVYDGPKLSDSVVKKMRERIYSSSRGKSPVQQRQSSPPIEEDSTTDGETVSSPRSIQKIRGRRTLSRHVLESNASKLLPVSDIVSLRRSITKESTLSAKETLIGSNETIISLSETHEELTTEKDNVLDKSTEKVLPDITSEDVSMHDADYGFKLNNEPPAYVYDGPKLSDSVLEKMQERLQLKTEKSETEEKLPANSDESFRENTKNFQNEPSYDSNEENKHDDCDDVFLRKGTEDNKDDDAVTHSNVAIEDDESMDVDVYADLDEENKEAPLDEEVSSPAFEELSNSTDNRGISTTKAPVESEERGLPELSDRTHNLGFLATRIFDNTCKDLNNTAHLETKETDGDSPEVNEDIIEIGSSSDDQKSSSSEDTINSEENILNIPFIKNISDGSDECMDFRASEESTPSDGLMYNVNIFEDVFLCDDEKGDQDTDTVQVEEQIENTENLTSKQTEEENAAIATVNAPSKGTPRQRRPSLAESTSKRMTRRSSLLLSETDDNPDNSLSSGRHRGQQNVTPLRKSLRRLSQNSLHVDGSDPPTPQRNLRTRSASVDQILESDVRKRSLRSSSVDNKIDDNTNSLSKVDSNASTVDLNEHPNKTPKRLTRKSLQVDQIDPIKLLDKPSFAGEPDPEEAKVYEESPPTLKPAQRSRRTASTGSDVPQMGGIKTRLRTKSTDSSQSELSMKSDIPSPPKKNKKNYAASDAGSVRSTRSRSLSISSVVSEPDPADSPRRSTRLRRPVAHKTDLPEITEEKPVEVGEGKSSRKKRAKPVK